MRRGTFKKAEAGIGQLTVITIVVLVIGLAIGIYFMARSKNNSNDTATDQSTADLTTNTVDGRNSFRLADASSLLSSAVEFATNNNGSLPTMFTDGSLTGETDMTPSPVVLDLYTDVVIAKGAQKPVTSTTELRLVAGATCESGGATKAGGSRAVAAQYATEKDNSGYTSECKEG